MATYYNASRAWYLVNNVDVRVYKSHKSVDELKESIKNAVDKYYAVIERKKSVLSILHFVARHSYKSFGVSWLKVKSIASALSLDERTVRRALKLLESLHIIKRYRTRKMSGLRGVDIVVILPVKPQLSPSGDNCKNQEMSAHKTIKLKSFKIKRLKDRKRDDDNARTREEIIIQLEGIEKEVYTYALSLGVTEKIALKVIHGMRVAKYTLEKAKLVIKRAVKYYGQALEGAANVAAVFAASIKREMDKPVQKTVERKSRQTKQAKSVQKIDKASTFQEAVRKQLDNKQNKYIAPVPQNLQDAWTRDREVYEKQEAEHKAKLAEESYEEKKAKLLQMLEALGELP